MMKYLQFFKHMNAETFNALSPELKELALKQAAMPEPLCDEQEERSVEDNDAILRLWLLRIMVTLGGHKKFLYNHGFHDDAIAQFLGVMRFDKDSEPFNSKFVLSAMREQLASLPAIDMNSAFAPIFTNNLSLLTEKLKLTEAEVKVLVFAIHLHANSLLDDACDMLDALTSVKLYRSLSLMLDLSEKEVQAALANTSLLTRSGLVKVDRNGVQRMRGKLELVSSSVYDLMHLEAFEPLDLLKDMVMQSKSAELSLSDYVHIQAQLDIAMPYLKHALDTKQAGVNIFLYGQPGTGKTQWVKTMAQALGVDCFEVSTIDRDGDSIQGGRRLSACAAAQNLLKDNPCLLMFDEVEDVFTASEYGSKSPAESRKAWFNQLLEQNDVPTIWISNKHRGIDPAFIRRFDIVFEMTMPSAEQRQGMLMQYGQGLLSVEASTRFAKTENLSPAVIQRVSRVIAPISDTLTTEKRDATFEQLVNQTLALQGHDPIEKADTKKQILPTTYNPKYLNTNADMTDITEALKSCGSARLCLYGPPGTGKTAYGHYLSTQCDKPLHLKKASDLLSMFVGGTEANMAQAFKSATEEGAILMIDEVDSFISDRNNAVRSWEVTAINEMLTQMEAFEGLFIASTNRMDGLDPAALRRFDLKVKVDYLAYEQRLGLFSDNCVQMGFTTNENINDDLISLTNLTPGDFAAVSRQSKFRPIKSAQDLYVRLSEECALKGGAKPFKIGF